MTGLALGVVLVGFARTYFLKGLFGTPSLSLLLHLHGAVMTAWFLLFGAQAALIRARRVDLHRSIGVAGAAFALILVQIAFAAARGFVIRSLNDPELLPIAAAIAGYDTITLAVFAILVGAALSWRRRADIHKRLMTLAALSLLGPPIRRWWATKPQYSPAICLFWCRSQSIRPGIDDCIRPSGGMAHWSCSPLVRHSSWSQARVGPAL